MRGLAALSEDAVGMRLPPNSLQATIGRREFQWSKQGCLHLGGSAQLPAQLRFQSFFLLIDFDFDLLFLDVGFFLGLAFVLFADFFVFVILVFCRI